MTFEKADDAANAISALDKTEVNGRTVNLEIAKPPSSTPRTSWRHMIVTKLISEFKAAELQKKQLKQLEVKPPLPTMKSLALARPLVDAAAVDAVAVACVHCF